MTSLKEILVHLEGDFVVACVGSGVQRSISLDLPRSNVDHLEVVNAGLLCNELDDAGAALTGHTDVCVAVLLD